MFRAHLSLGVAVKAVALSTNHAPRCVHVQFLLYRPILGSLLEVCFLELSSFAVQGHGLISLAQVGLRNRRVHNPGSLLESSSSLRPAYSPKTPAALVQSLRFYCCSDRCSYSSTPMAVPALTPLILTRRGHLTATIGSELIECMMIQRFNRFAVMGLTCNCVRVRCEDHGLRQRQMHGQLDPPATSMKPLDVQSCHLKEGTRSAREEEMSSGALWHWMVPCL